MEQALKTRPFPGHLLAGEHRAEIRKGRDRPQRTNMNGTSEKQWSSKEARPETTPRHQLGIREQQWCR